MAHPEWRRSVKIVIFVYLAIGAIYASSGGIYTRKVLNVIDRPHAMDEVNQLISAGIDEKRKVVVACLRGRFAGGGEVFTYIWPSEIANPDEVLFKRDGYELSSSNEGELYISRGMTSPGCNMKEERPVNVYGSSEKLVHQNERTVYANSLELNVGEREAVYLVNFNGNGALIYLADHALYPNDYNTIRGGDIRNDFFNIVVAPAKAKPSYKWWLILPFAFIFDAVTFPWQVFVWFKFLYP